MRQPASKRSRTPVGSNWRSFCDQSIYRWIAAGLISATARGLTKKRRYLITASEVERAKREGNFEGKVMPALINA